MSGSPKTSRIKVTEDEHRLIQRYREQARAFNEGVAASAAIVLTWDRAKPHTLEEIAEAIVELRKETI